MILNTKIALDIELPFANEVNAKLFEQFTRDMLEGLRKLALETASLQEVTDYDSLWENFDCITSGN